MFKFLLKAFLTIYCFIQILKINFEFSVLSHYNLNPFLELKKNSNNFLK
jgi:hypothetical protein